MPFNKVRQYKRINVGAYMREKRLASVAEASKRKHLVAKKRKLERFNKKVGWVFICQLMFLIQLY